MWNKNSSAQVPRLLFTVIIWSQFEKQLFFLTRWREAASVFTAGNTRRSDSTNGVCLEARRFFGDEWQEEGVSLFLHMFIWLEHFDLQQLF